MLIVDDEVQARELLSEFCRAQGDEVATANDGPFALGQLEVVLRRIRDRMSLEEENRELSRRVVGHESQTSGDLTWRLQAIEERLADIDALLRARS